MRDQSGVIGGCLLPGHTACSSLSPSAVHNGWQAAQWVTHTVYTVPLPLAGRVGEGQRKVQAPPPPGHVLITYTQCMHRAGRHGPSTAGDGAVQGLSRAYPIPNPPYPPSDRQHRAQHRQPTTPPPRLSAARDRKITSTCSPRGKDRRCRPTARPGRSKRGGGGLCSWG